MSNGIAKHSIFKNFSTLFAGLVAVQLINFLFSLLLPKYFSPADFAEFGIFTSVAFILIEIINAKLDIAVMLPEKDAAAREVLDAAFTVACLLFLCICVLCIPVFFYYSKLYALLPFTLLIYGIHQPVLVYLNKQNSYMTINWFRILQVLNTMAVTLILALYNVRHALIYGFIFGLAVATLFLITYVRPVYNYSALKKVWKQYGQFPKYGTWSSLLNTISRNSIPLLLAQFFSQYYVGLYSYATRLLNAPTGMYASALGQVYFKTAGESGKEELKQTTRKIVTITFLFGIIPSVVILFFGQDIFLKLFSEEWMEAGKISQYLILWYLLGVMTAPVSSLLDIRNKLKFELRFNALLFTGRIAAILIGGILQDFYLALLLFSITGILLNGYLLYYINNKLLNQ
jgi:O-antigen/teichoic acid export membrane protein